MAKVKFPGIGEINWGKIKEVKVTKSGKEHYFEFGLPGMDKMMTISIAPQSTSFKLADKAGKTLAHAVQKGQNVMLLDFSGKLELAGPAGKLRKIKAIKKTGAVKKKKK